MLLSMPSGCTLDQDLVDGPKPFDGGDSGWTLDPGESESASGAPELCNGVDDDGDGEVDEDFADADADGHADCVDPECPELDVAAAGAVEVDEACLLAPLEEPWDVEMAWSLWAPSEAPTASYGGSSPLVAFLGDDNGDGDIGPGDRSTVVVIAYGGSDAWVTAVDATNGDELWSRGGFTPGSGLVVADIDGDGLPNVIATPEARRFRVLEGDGADLWTSEAGNDDNRQSTIHVADLDADGYAEVVHGDAVYDGQTGVERFSMFDEQPALSSTRIRPVVGDLEGDGRQEVFLHGAAFDAEGNELWALNRYQWESHPVLQDIDEDGDAEVIFVGGTWTVVDGFGVPVRWDDHEYTDTPPPCVGDGDGDGTLDLAAISSYGFAIRSLSLDTLAANEDLLLGAVYVEACTAFDLNGDGADEYLIPSNGAALNIVDGTSAEVLWNYPIVQTLGGGGSRSPTVADVDSDGHAEVFAAGSYRAWGLVASFRHAGGGWAGAGATWPTFEYSSTSRDDASVPVAPTPSWALDGYLRGREALPRQGENLVVTVTDACTADCVSGQTQIAVRVANEGGATVPAGVSLVLSTNDDSPRELARTLLPEVPGGTVLDGFVFEIEPADRDARGVTASVDVEDARAECDETDNLATWTDLGCF